MIKWFEDLFSAVNALGVCVFPADKLALGATDYAGLFSSYLEDEVPPEEFMKIGERIFNIQRLFIVREEIGRKDDIWPDRFSEEKIPDGPSGGSLVSRETIQKVLNEDSEARGYDPATGFVNPQTLHRVEISESI